MNSTFSKALGLIYFALFSQLGFSQPVATNQCISLNKPIYCSKPAEQFTDLQALVDGKDESYFDVTGPVEIAIQVDAENTTSSRLILHWRAKSWRDRNVNENSFQNLQLFTSHNSTDGINGDWVLVKSFQNKRKDNVLFFNNNKPKWVKVKELAYHHLSLGRLDVFQTAPPGKKNDFWLFFGDSETKGNMSAGNTNYEAETYFGDKIHELNPNYYPIIINGGKGGEMAREAVDSLPAILDELQEVSFVAFCYGLNDIFLSSPILVPYDAPENDAEMAIFEEGFKGIINVCKDRGILPIPGRIPWVSFPNSYCFYNDPSAINGVKPINRNVVDPVILSMTPYAFDLQANRPLADFETWYRDHRWQDKVFRFDKVHHDRYGINQFNLIWVNAAQKIVYDNQDSGNNGCPDLIDGFTKLGEFNGHGYYQSNNSMTWLEGQSLAEANAGYLASISSAGENNFIKNLIQEIVYIGLNDMNSEGIMEWVDGSNNGYENFNVNCSWCSKNGSEVDFAVMLPWDGTWAFEKETVTRKVIIEVNCGESPSMIDMQCPDNLAVTLAQNATSMVVNWAEPIVTSTCTGSVNTLQVVGSQAGSLFGVGSHPITYQATNSCNQSANCSFVIQVNPPVGNGTDCGEIVGFSKLGEWQDKTYYLSNTAQTWTMAKSTCTTNGGALMQVSSQEENDFVVNLIDEMVYIGLNDVAQEGNMKWVDGSAVSFTNYSNCDWCGLNNQENDFGVLLPWNGTWAFNNSVVTRKYLMQKNCNAGGGGGTNNCPQTLSGYSNLGSFNNHNYYLSNVVSNWEDANTSANAAGYLVTINTQAENDFLQSKIGNAMVLIGYSDKALEGQGAWANGEPVTLDLSFGNTPNKDYAIMNFWKGTWKMENGIVAKRHVLEMNCAAPLPPKTNLQNEQFSLLRLFPNPANEVITIQFIARSKKEIKFSIINAQGQEQIHTEELIGEGLSERKFDITHLKKGIYFLKISGQTINEVVQFFKVNP